METPFSRRMKQFADENKLEVKSFSPILLGEGKAPTLGEGRAPLMGDIKPRDPESLAIDAEKKQLTSNLEGSKQQIQQAAAALRQQVASGQISMADAEHQMDLLVNKVTDNSYMGWGDFDMRTRAAEFGEKAGDAYGMYEMGLDPAMMAREQERLRATEGVLSDMPRGSNIPLGEGKAPLLGEGKAPLMRGE